MSNKRMEFLIGGMVLTVFITIIVMTILFGAPKKIFSSGGSERMTIVFDKAPGIGNNSRVLKSGVEIGRVISVDLKDDEDHSEVHVVFRLAPNVQIYTNEYARIQRTVLGDASIEFVKNPNYTGKIAVRKVEDPISGVPGGDLMGAVSNIEGDLAKAIRQVNDAAEEMTTFIAKINVLLGSAEDIDVKKSKIDDILGSLGDTLKSTSVLAGNINAIVGDENVRNSVLSSAKILPETIEKIQTIVNDAYSLSDDFKYIIQNSGKTVDSVNANLDNLKSFTDSLSKDGPDFIASLTASGEDLQEMVNNINQLAAELNSAIKDSDTPIGMLRDPSIGASFRNTVQNVEAVTANANDITEGVQERIYPILDDARIFTNKIAHKPSLLLWGGNTYKGTPTILGNGKFNFQERTPNAGFASTLYRPSAAHRAASGANGYGICPKTNGQSEMAPVIIDPNAYEVYAARGAWAQGGYTNERKSCLSGLLDKNRGSMEGISGIEMTGSEMIASGVEENRGACRSTPICRLADRSVSRMKFSLSKLFGCRDEEPIEYASGYPSDAARYQEYPGVYMDPAVEGNVPMLYDGGVPYEGAMMSQPPMMLDGADYSGAQPA
ncbi:MAG: MCE family protein, partial [Thermoguttaceae bacterium]|nr:MCE family protein [Thermoguttaceae bacterium]